LWVTWPGSPAGAGSTKVRKCRKHKIIKRKNGK
jgi:hypothetical protein